MYFINIYLYFVVFKIVLVGGYKHYIDLEKFLDDSREKISNILRREESSEDFKSILEEKYKFNSDGSSRFKISSANKDNSEMGSGEAWFRTFAGRRIVGGMETDIYTYPYNVAIQRSGRHWCGGSLIDEQWVLSAGHCFESAYDGDKNKYFTFVLRAGSSFHNRGGYQARPNKVFFPPGYAPGNADFDVSLVRLDRPMPIGRNIAVLNLPSRGFRATADDVIVVTGWGSMDKTGINHVPERLRFVPVPLMNTNECQNFYKFFITPRMVCAGYDFGGKDACNHDSGGPAVKDGVLIGVVSFGGKICGDPKSPGVYSRVSEMTNWVQQIVEGNEAATVPELQPKIQKARMREQELDKIKENLETKKRSIKEWLRNAFKSQNFIRIAKKKLADIGLNLRREAGYRRKDSSNTTIDEETLDNDNLNSLIDEKIINIESKSEEDKMIHVLALHEIMESDEGPMYRETEKDSVERYIAHLL